VAGDPLDRDVEPIPAGSADGELLRRAAVEVEGQLRPAQVRGLHEAGPVEAHLLLDGEQERERRVGQAVTEDLAGCGEHDGDAGPIVAAEAGRGVGALHEPARHDGLRAAAHGHGVHVGHEQPPRARQRARQLHDQVADLPGEGRLPVRGVEGDRVGRAARLAQPLHDPLGHTLLRARHPGDREQFQQQGPGRAEVGLGHGDAARGGGPGADGARHGRRSSGATAINERRSVSPLTRGGGRRPRHRHS
jgi:hypothetical protein